MIYPKKYTNEIVGEMGNTVHIRSNLLSMDDINNWVSEFGELNSTHWNYRSSIPNGQRIVCSFRCRTAYLYLQSTVNDVSSGFEIVGDSELNDSCVSGIHLLDTSFINNDLIDDSDALVICSNVPFANAVHNARTVTKNAQPCYSPKYTVMKKNPGLLASIGLKNCKQLTPKCKMLYSVTNQLLKKQRRLNSKKQLFKCRLRVAEQFSETYLKRKLADKVTPAASLFTRLQLRETLKKKKGHRFTLEEKLLSLSIYKKSPKCYRLLSIIFTLPSKRTLNNILSSVHIGPGVSSVVMHVLKENVQKLKPTERYCSLIFDEISLSSGLHYNASTDEIDSFVNSGHYKSQELADHAMVFMIRGIKKKFKQPVAFSFCQGAPQQHELVRQLKEVIQKVHETGLRVVATICDQGKSNEDAIRLLNNETRAYYLKNHNDQDYREEFYEVPLINEERIKIIHIFDVPHLLKCTRNNLINKTKSIIEPSAIDTAIILLFFDKLFDSMNGSFSKVIEGKIYRIAVTKNSVHHELWSDSLKVLSSMCFYSQNGKRVNVPTVRNWITTIKEKGIKSILPRHLNQDPIENLFGAVRSLGCENPYSSSFISAYKTLLLNNLISSQSPGANCEDFTENTLVSYQNFFISNQKPHTPVKLIVDLPIQIQRNLDTQTNHLTDLTHTYISGFIAKKLNREMFKNCDQCLKKICSSQVTREHELITAREYKANKMMSLKYPVTEFRVLIHNIMVYISGVLPSKCHFPEIGMILLKEIMTNYDLTILHCSNHDELFTIKIAKSLLSY
ncbi:hypothetical protein ACI65C_004859 [Semiaphis heraclei]